MELVYLFIKFEGRWKEATPVLDSGTLVIGMHDRVLRSNPFVSVSPLVLLSSYQFHQSLSCAKDRVIDLLLLH